MAIVFCVPAQKKERIVLTGRNFKFAAAVTGYPEEYLRWTYLEHLWMGVPCKIEVG